MKNKIILILLFLINLNYASARDTTETKQLLNLDAKLNSLILANVGNLKISADEFLTSYENGPAFVKREKNSLRKYLDFMIYEKILTLYGYENHVDTSQDVKRTLNDIEGDLASDELYKDLIWNNISISKSEIEKAAGKQQVELEIKWIYSDNFNEIKSKYLSIKNGLPFDSLFIGQFKDSIKYDDRFLKTTRYNLEKINPALAEIVDSLKIGEISGPIKTPDGWYIVKINDIWKDEITTESDKNKLLNDMEKSLFKRQADSLSDAFVNRIIMEKKPVIKHEIFSILKLFIGRQILNSDDFKKWSLIKKAEENNPGFDISRVSEYENKVLVIMKGGSIKLKDFLNWYDTRSAYIKLGKNSYKDFSVSLQQIIWRMVRDKLLIDLACARGYNKKENVVTQMKWWKDKTVYSKVKMNLANSIKADDTQLMGYYKNNLNSYKDKNGKVKPFDEVKEMLYNDFYIYAFTKKIVNKVLSLKSKYNISVDENKLNSLTVDIKDDPHAIDVYAVKKGGTFPRPAFPTIDYEWQFWR